ncbi:MAG: hypothetical protein AAGH74_05415 [Pseudomonadota bacterium]
MTETKPAPETKAEMPRIGQLFYAMVMTPLAWSGVVALIIFIIGGSTERDFASTLNYTLDNMMILFPFFFAFTATLGVLGVWILRLLDQRSSAAWAMMGGLMGAVVAAINAFVFPAQLNNGAMIFFVVMGWAIFLTIRWLAKIRAG